MLMKLRRDNETNNRSALSVSRSPAPLESQVLNQGFERFKGFGGANAHKFEKLQKREAQIKQIPSKPQITDTKNSCTYNKESRDASVRSTRSDNNIHGYAYSGRGDKRLFVNKADLRFDITDINEKKRKFKYTFEKEHPKDKERLLGYLKAQNLDRYSKALPEKPIEQVVDYGRGVYRPEQSKFMEVNPNNNSYIVHQNNSTIRRLDEMKQMMRTEAHVTLGDVPIIVRDKPVFAQIEGFRGRGRSNNHSARSFK